MVVKIADAVKRYSYLQSQTGLFKHFVDIKVIHPFSDLDNLKPFFLQLPMLNTLPSRMLNPVRKGESEKRLYTKPFPFLL